MPGSAVKAEVILVSDTNKVLNPEAQAGGFWVHGHLGLQSEWDSLCLINPGVRAI